LLGLGGPEGHGKFCQLGTGKPRIPGCYFSSVLAPFGARRPDWVATNQRAVQSPPVESRRESCRVRRGPDRPLHGREFRLLLGAPARRFPCRSGVRDRPYAASSAPWVCPGIGRLGPWAACAASHARQYRHSMGARRCHPIGSETDPCHPVPRAHPRTPCCRPTIGLARHRTVPGAGYLAVLMI
jgi:hypothetical protein